jgi:hypothetical protein
MARAWVPSVLALAIAVVASSASTAFAQEVGAPQPGVQEPGAQQGVSQSGVSQPGVSQPGVSQPGVSQPGVQQPGVQQPGVQASGAPPQGAAASLQSPEPAPDAVTANSIVEVPAPRHTGETSGGFSPWPFGIVLTGIGATGIVAGLLMGATALVQSDDAQEGFMGTPGCVDTHCTESAFASLAAAHTLANYADAVLFTGVGLAVIGLILTFALGDWGGDTTASAACDANGCQAAVRGVF